MDPPTRRDSAFGKLRRMATSASQRHRQQAAGADDSDDLDSSSSSEDELADRHEASKTRAVDPEQTTLPGRNFPSTTLRLGPSRFHITNDKLRVHGKSSKRDGRLKISIRHAANRAYMSKTLDAGLSRHRGSARPHHPHLQSTEDAAAPSAGGIPLSKRAAANDRLSSPRMNIVIMVIGSRGDIQPFIKVGRILKEQYGHRVRVATHPSFRKFVQEDCGMEHFNVGGDPSELMAFMVKNPGLIPNLDTIRKGEIGRRRSQMYEMFGGFWRACVDSTDDPTQVDSATPFVADAIIANPPSFAHVHCAERLGCPLHIMFTFPYSPTHDMPHPLSNIKPGNTDQSYANFLSYPLVEMMTWQGLGDLVNDFRVKTLGLDPVSKLWAPGQLYRMKVPYTYLWSPGLVPKPSDWGPEINISGFVFLDLASDFKPPQDLQQFLDQGDKPLYIGFGSIVLDDPEAFTQMIFAAVQQTGVRAVINKGWGGFGGTGDVPDGVFMLENTPHDWLFPRCKAVIHHGGAGTTAIGLKCAKPTMIVPFFGDQTFWGSMVSEAKAGAHECINHRQLTVEKFVKGIEECLSEEAQRNVQRIADSIAQEGDGAANAVQSFHASLPLSSEDTMRCAVLQDRIAVWQHRRSKLRLSALAAELLVSEGKLEWRDLRLRRQYAWNDYQGYGGPITGGSAAVYDMVTAFTRSVGEGPLILGRDMHERALHEQRRIRHVYRRRQRRKAAEARDKPTSSSAPRIMGEQKAQTPATDRPPLLRGQSVFPDCSTQNSSAIAHQLRRARSQPQATSSADPAESSGSRPSATRHETELSVLSVGPEHGLMFTVAKDTATGIGKPIWTIVKFPMDLLVSTAQGFHNLPRLYGDPTVRRPPRISGYKSGLKAAGQELVFGAYDAVTGLVILPYKDVKARGPLGLATGVGKGLGGVVCKGCAAVIGPFGYTLKGLHRELTKSQTPVVEVQQKRIAQGTHELAALGEQERAAAREAAKRGWQTLAQIWKEADKVKRGEWNPDKGTVKDTEGQWVGGRLAAGLMGRIRFESEVKKYQRHGAFESVEDTAQAVRARKRGETLEQACGPAGK